MFIKLLALSTFLFYSYSLAQHEDKILNAAAPRHPLSKRDSAFRPSLHERSLFYAEATPSYGKPSFGARINIQPNLPTILLEDIEWSLRSVECSTSEIVLQFTDILSFLKAREAWSDLSDFYVISSHSGCNQAGHRVPYKANIIAFHVDELGVKIPASAVPWSQMSKTTTIGFGTGIEHGSLRQPELSGEFNLLRKRQSSTASRTVPTNFPPPPTGTPTVGNSSKADVSFSFVNKSILPPEINGIPAQAIAIPNTVFKCLNCTATGQIEVKHGLITLQGDFDVARAANDPLDFIQEGFVEVDVRQLRASIDLETTVSGNIPLAQWSLGLPTVPLSPFTIAGVASIGPIFAPVLEGSVQVASQLAVTYGFDVSVPDNSSLKFDILNASNSKIVGFNQSSLKAHPVSVNISEPTLTLSAAFKPQVLIGISIAGQRAGLGVFANLPRLQVDIKQLSNVNKKCERTNTTQNATGIIDEALGLFTGNLTHIMPSINLDIGLTENVDLTFLDPIQSEVVLFSATDLVPLPTACMSWNKKHAALTTIDARNTGQANPPDPDITTTASPSIANKSPSVPIASATESKKASEGDVISVKLKATWAVFALANIFIATMI